MYIFSLPPQVILLALILSPSPSAGLPRNAVLEEGGGLDSAASALEGEQ